MFIETQQFKLKLENGEPKIKIHKNFFKLRRRDTIFKLPEINSHCIRIPHQAFLRAFKQLLGSQERIEKIDIYHRSTLSKRDYSRYTGWA